MKILLSAYACEPDKGSEPGIGWNWAVELTKLGYEVYVITRANNEPSIIKEMEMNPNQQLHFIYYDLPSWSKFWKRGGRGVHLYYILWQIGAYLFIKKYHKNIKFDLVHHITFGVIRHPSFMGRLDIPFIIGPLGGGERTPYVLRKYHPIRGKLLDLLRDFLNYLVKFDPLMLYTFGTANKIYVKTPESKKVIPKFYHHKTYTQLEIGTRLPADSNGKIIGRNKKNINFLFVGRFIYWKGGHFILMAFTKALQLLPDIRLTMIGQGPEEKAWKELALSEGIDYAVDWIPWMKHEELRTVYESHDIFLFPSLHDSSGNVVLEAMTYGLPVICLQLGGPGILVDKSCGEVIPIGNSSIDNVVNSLAEAICKISNDIKLYEDLSNGAIKRASNLNWGNTLRSIYKCIS